MINIGIDFGKFKHCASAIDDKTGEILITPFFFNNDQKGFNLFYSKTKQYLHRKHAVGMEDTGHYLVNLTDFLLDNALFKELVDSPQKRTEKTEEVSMIFL